MAVMPFKCIDSCSEVLVYGEVEGGYQRKPEPKHYNKIRDYILTNLSEFILPTGVVLGLDNSLFSKLNKAHNGKNVLELDSSNTEKVLRIVDGQHRIYGLREACKKEPSISSYQLPVIIVLTKENKRSKELEIFNDINSKAKRVKVDLIKLAEYEYRLKEDSINSANLTDHICIKTAYILKEDKPESVWHNAIKFDIHNDLILGIIGVKSFMESIEVIVKVYLRTHDVKVKPKYSDLLEYVNKASADISSFLFTCWDEHIKNKWPDAFDSQKIQMDIDEELKTYYYKKDYYIQKTFGVKALNGLISDVYRENNAIPNKSLANIKLRLSQSKIKNEDWRIGGRFSGLSSESGVKKVKDMI